MTILKEPSLINSIEIFTDFDGTITKQDCLEFLLNKYAHTSWLDIEEQVLKGKMSEIKALQAEFDLIKATPEEAVKTVAEEIGIDPFFRNFLKWTKERNINLTVLSGGFTNFIKEIFKREGIENIKIIANNFSVIKKHWKIIKATVPPLCPQCNHCKTKSIIDSAKKGNFVIYIGDGTTDRCASLFSNFVFAKDSLLDFCANHNVPHYEFTDFADILLKIETILTNSRQYKALYPESTENFPPREVYIGK